MIFEPQKLLHFLRAWALVAYKQVACKKSIPVFSTVPSAYKEQPENGFTLVICCWLKTHIKHDYQKILRYSRWHHFRMILLIPKNILNTLVLFHCHAGRGQSTQFKKINFKNASRHYYRNKTAGPNQYIHFKHLFCEIG